MPFEQLRLDNQLCFPLYAASRLVTRSYQPLLEKLDLTYPQYLVLMILWEKDGVSVNEIADRLILNTNTVTPLLKRMESGELITRKRSGKDERKVMIALTEKGRELESRAAEIPVKILEALEPAGIPLEELENMKSALCRLMHALS